jgi:hypothetical protein
MWWEGLEFHNSNKRIIIRPYCETDELNAHDWIHDVVADIDLDELPNNKGRYIKEFLRVHGLQHTKFLVMELSEEGYKKYKNDFEKKLKVKGNV